MPTRTEWKLTFDALGKAEKIVFYIFFLIAWVSGTLLLIKLDSDFSTKVPSSGGSLTEGIVGTPRFINPLIAVSDADRDVTRIVYSGLMRTDNDGNLVPHLAEEYTVSDDGLTYFFRLRENLFWHDDKPLTTEDVAFTINLAKNPAIRSPRLANWEGIAVRVLNERELEFILNKPFAPFLENTTMGILPKHLWEHIPPDEFNLSELNTHPIGSGPYYIDSANTNSTGSIVGYRLKRFKKYQPEIPRIDALTIQFYTSESALKEAVQQGAVTNVAGIIPDVPVKSGTTIDIRLPRVIGLYFNQDTAPILREKPLRDALSFAIDRERIIREVINGFGEPTSLPIPPGTFSHASSLEEITYNPDVARAILEEHGFRDTNDDGIVEKTAKEENIPVTFSIATLNTPELKHTAEILQQMWREIGVNTEIQLYEQGDFEQNILRPREYESILFGQVMGTIPDPFAFWHTSQRSHPGLNIALYANSKVDKWLEEARSTIDDNKRRELLVLFQQEVADEKPALFLYSPTLTYIVPQYLKGIDIKNLSYPQERFGFIETWYTTTKSVWNIFL